VKITRIGARVWCSCRALTIIWGGDYLIGMVFLTVSVSVSVSVRVRVRVCVCVCVSVCLCKGWAIKSSIYVTSQLHSALTY
jgi:hypothetical protein